MQHERDAALQAQLRDLSGGDARIRFLPALAHSDVISTLRQYDALVVPSQWMETGPLVVLEAFAAGVPVIGSALGGLTDKIRDGIDGVLVAPFDSVDAWRCRARPAGARARVGAGHWQPASRRRVPCWTWPRDMTTVYQRWPRRHDGLHGGTAGWPTRSKRESRAGCSATCSKSYPRTTTGSTSGRGCRRHFALAIVAAAAERDGAAPDVE